jgi:hypothetical protein
MWDVMNANIREFASTHPDQFFPHEIWLNDLEAQFPVLWKWVGCEGDLDAALAETRIRHNANA